jgi:hypothetical protein
MAHAAAAGHYDADLLAVTARAHLAAKRAPRAPIPLPPNAIAAGTRATPSLAGYDQLLTPALEGELA